MNKTTIPILILILLPLSAGYGQKNNSMFSLDSASQAVLDTALSIQKRVNDFLFDGKISIYEFGDSLVDCETNFKNLWHNWHTGNVTNAEEYEFLNFFFVETISDSTKYNYYRNYFSGNEQLTSSNTSESKSISSNGEETHTFIIRPGFRYIGFFDTRLLPDELKPFFTMDFLKEAQNLLKIPFCVDTMKLVYYYSFGYSRDTTTNIIPGGFSSYRTGEESSIWSVAAPDSLSQNYFDLFVTHKIGIDELSVSEMQKLKLKDTMVQRIRDQLLFSHQVNIGDKVYAIKFKYDGTTYTNYVVCNPTTKKVVLDYFFSRITVDNKEIKSMTR